MTIQTLYTAATGMEAMESKLDVIANNMANISTTGFKKDRANFEDVFYRQYRLPGAQDAGRQSHGDGHRSWSWYPHVPARSRTSSRARFKRPTILSTLLSKGTDSSRCRIRAATASITREPATSI